MSHYFSPFLKIDYGNKTKNFLKKMHILKYVRLLTDHSFRFLNKEETPFFFE